MRFDLDEPLARAQLDAYRAFEPRFAAAVRDACAGAPPRPGRPRVLLTAFGPFAEHTTNATTDIVRAIAPAFGAPLGQALRAAAAPPGASRVDDPAHRTAFAVTTLPDGGVDALALVLPVAWGLSTSLVAHAAEAFRPDAIIMNGIAGPRQPLWIELGATNGAEPAVDGSRNLSLAGDRRVPVDNGRAPEETLPCRFAFTRAKRAAEATLAALGRVCEAGERFDDVVTGVRFTPPRASNAYVCNALTYGVACHLAARATPFVFLHWPSSLRGAHVAAAASLLRGVVDAHVEAASRGEPIECGDQLAV